MDKQDTTALTALCFGAVALFAIVVATGAAQSHEATNLAGQPMGWQYGWECCSQMDCKPVPKAEIEEPNADHPGFYKVMSTGEMVAANSSKIKQSKDEDFHWCAHQNGPNAGKTICIYVPPRGF